MGDKGKREFIRTTPTKLVSVLRICRAGCATLAFFVHTMLVVQIFVCGENYELCGENQSVLDFPKHHGAQEKGADMGVGHAIVICCF